MRGALQEGFRHDGGFWRRLAFAGSAYAPKWWVRWSPPFFAAAFFALVHPNRRAAIANLDRVLGGRGAGRAALRMFVEFAYCMTEMMEQLGPRPRPLRFDVPRREVFLDLLGQGRGLVLVTAHLGNWEVSAKGLHDLGYPVNVVMAQERNASVVPFVEEMRERTNVEVIYSDATVFSGVGMLHALRRNEIVALQLDRSLPGSATRAVEFFGRPAAFPVGPFALARAARAPILPIFAPRLGACRYEVRIGEPIEIGSGPRDEVIGRGMDAAVCAFERVVAEFPAQWFQFRPFWP